MHKLSHRMDPAEEKQNKIYLNKLYLTQDSNIKGRKIKNYY